jgi:hypothetical protein
MAGVHPFGEEASTLAPPFNKKKSVKIEHKINVTVKFNTN